MKEGDLVYITDRTRVVETVVVLDLTLNSSDPLFELKEPGRNSSFSTYFKHQSEIYTDKQAAYAEAIALAEKNLEQAEKASLLAKAQLRWAKHDLKHLRKEADKLKAKEK